MRSGQVLDVGNDFIMPKKTIGINLNVMVSESYPVPITVTVNHGSKLLSEDVQSVPRNYFKFLDFLYTHSVISFSLLILAIALIAQPIVLSQIGNKPDIKPLVLGKKSAPYGLNLSVKKDQLQSWLNSYAGQSSTVNLGTKTVAIDSSVLKSWLKISSAKNSSTVGVHVNTTLVASSLASLANKYNVKPIDQVSAIRSDGSSEIAVAGRNGIQLDNSANIAAQAQEISKNLFSNKGFQLNAPLVTVPFQNVTPSAFNKLLLADVNSKKMYVYQDGQLVNTFLVSAGAPATPTPIGEFHIYEKLSRQNMSGFNPNGTKYFQPNVQWINYFYGGDAVHGVYWHPLSWFGVHNSSHGCVGLPDDQAQWVYNWAPIGTTVITTPN